MRVSPAPPLVLRLLRLGTDGVRFFMQAEAASDGLRRPVGALAGWGLATLRAMDLLNDSKKKKTHKLTPSERALVLEKAPLEGVSAVARQFGVTPSAVSQLLTNREAAFTEQAKEREATAIRHALDNEDAAATEICRLMDGCIDVVRQRQPDGSYLPDAPYRVTVRELPAVAMANTLANTLAKIRRWGADRSGDALPGEVLRVEEVKRVIVSRA